MWKFKTTESKLWANFLFFPADMMEKNLKLALSLQSLGYRNLNPPAQSVMKVVCVIVNLHMTSPITVIDQHIEQNCINSTTITTITTITRNA